MLQIIDEIGDLIHAKGKDESRAQLSAAYIRWGQAQRDHAEVAEAHRALELAQADQRPALPRVRGQTKQNPSHEPLEPTQESDDEPGPTTERWCEMDAHDWHRQATAPAPGVARSALCRRIREPVPNR
jgi:hypothetical protein